jgi:hypothetical protein
MQTGRGGDGGSLSRPLPIPCGDGTRGAGGCREVLCSGGLRWRERLYRPRTGSPGQEQLVSTQAPHQAGLLRILPVPPTTTKSRRLASRRVASRRVASRRGLFPRCVRLSWTLRAQATAIRPQPRGSRPRRGWARGVAEILVRTPRPACMRRAPAGGRGGGMQGGRDGGPALAPRRPPPLPPVREGGASPRRFRQVTWSRPPVREGGVSPCRSRHATGSRPPV